MRLATLLMLALSVQFAACSDESTAPLPQVGQAAKPAESVTLEYPAEDPGPPFYALLERTFVPHSDEWAPIIFVRDPECVPADFDLLDQLDVPASFGCGLNVQGHVTYKNGPPPVDLAPWQVVMNDAGPVPIWFVPWTGLQAAIADGELTIGELSGIAGLRVGTATQFQLTQQPGPMRPQGIGNGKIELTARGSLSNGTSFSIEIREMGVDQVSTLRNVRIEFR